MKHAISEAPAREAIKQPTRHPKPKRPSQPAAVPGPAMLARLRKAAAMPEADINLSDPDAPLVTDWSGAERGRFFKPVKRLKSFRIDADVLAYFEGQGKGYQATVNRVLREAMQRGLPGARASKSSKTGSKPPAGV